jgi:hypothetical protein
MDKASFTDGLSVSWGATTRLHLIFRLARRPVAVILYG